MLSGVAAQPGEFIEMREYTLQPDGHKAYMASSEPMAGARYKLLPFLG